MRIVFMGTPEAAVPTLSRCLDDYHNVVAVWTQPDKPAGRGKKVTQSPVKTFALSRDIPVYQPARIKTEESKQVFASHDADVAVVVAYGRILPVEYLTTPRLGCINVHFSLLPYYRGAAPVNWAIVNGESITGVTTMFIQEQLDSGPILLQQTTGIEKEETAEELMSRLSHIGADLLSETLSNLNNIVPRPQVERDATFAPMLRKEDGLINWSQDAVSIERLIRGLQPWPNAFTEYKSRRLVIWKASPVTAEIDRGSGSIIAADGDDLIVKCGGRSALRILEIQSEGARRMPARDFINGSHIKTGERFGTTQ